MHVGRGVVGRGQTPAYQPVSDIDPADHAPDHGARRIEAELAFIPVLVFTTNASTADELRELVARHLAAHDRLPVQEADLVRFWSIDAPDAQPIGTHVKCVSVRNIDTPLIHVPSSRLGFSCAEG